MNASELRKIGTASPTAAAVTAYLGKLERNRTETSLFNVRRGLVRSGHKVHGADYRAFWRALQTAGAGKLTIKRAGKAVRFAWSQPLKTIVDRLLGGQPAERQEAGLVGFISTPYTRVSFDTGSPERTIRMDLPQDVSKDEIEKLHAALLGMAP